MVIDEKQNRWQEVDDALLGCIWNLSSESLLSLLLLALSLSLDDTDVRRVSGCTEMVESVSDTLDWILALPLRRRFINRSCWGLDVVIVDPLCFGNTLYPSVRSRMTDFWRCLAGLLVISIATAGLSSLRWSLLLMH